MKINTFLTPDLVSLHCNSDNTTDILAEIVKKLKYNHKVDNEKIILKKLLEREKLGSTSIGNNSAVPHTKLNEIKEPVIGIGISKKGIKYHADDLEPVHLIIVILSPNDTPIIHLQILSAAAALIKKSHRLINEIKASTNASDIINIIKKYEDLDD